MSRPNRITLAILTLCGAAALLWTVLAVRVAPGVIESGWRGESLEVVNGAFEEGISLPEYLVAWKAFWPGLLLNLIGLGVLAAVLARPETWSLARRALGATPRDVFHATPKMAIALILASLAVDEWYPLSQFAMYSTFSGQGGYVFVTNAQDEPIPVGSQAGIWLDEVQKILDTNVREERARRSLPPRGWYVGGPKPADEVVEAAAVRTLLYLRDERLRDRPALKLWRTRISQRDGAIFEERELLGEVPGG